MVYSADEYQYVCEGNVVIVGFSYSRNTMIDYYPVAVSSNIDDVLNCIMGHVHQTPHIEYVVLKKQIGE